MGFIVMDYPIRHCADDFDFKKFKNAMNKRGIENVTEDNFQLALDSWGEWGRKLNTPKLWKMFIEESVDDWKEIIQREKIYW